jgi:Fe-S cluster assembly iron-binding protein IscA
VIVNVTDRAAARIKELIALEGRTGQALRVKVVGGGCSGVRISESKRKKSLRLRRIIYRLVQGIES